MSCVRPGVLLAKARRRCRARALIALDLPALERPAKAISGAPGRGRSRGTCTDNAYAAFENASALKSRSFRGARPPLPPRGSSMRFLTGFACAIALVYASVAPAAEADGKPDLERGKQLASTVCGACHGADGRSTAPTNPNLAAQHADYIVAQLTAFKSGARPSPIMQGMAASLTPEDMHAVGAYYSSQ